MARKPKLAETETLNGSNTLPALIEISEGKSVQLGEVVREAFDKSGMTVEAWNALAETDRDGLITQAIEVRKLVSAADAVGKIPAIPDPSEMVVARSRLIVSAPGGARRRAGLAFDVEPRELTEEELGATAEEVEARINALRADPKLKIDMRLAEIED